MIRPNPIGQDEEDVRDIRLMDITLGLWAELLGT
jgi:hypothetical protein